MHSTSFDQVEKTFLQNGFFKNNEKSIVVQFSIVQQRGLLVSQNAIHRHVPDAYLRYAYCEWNPGAT